MAAKQTGNAAQGALGPIRTKYKSFSLLALVCLITALCVLYLFFAWNRYSEEIAEDALSLAHSAEVMLQKEQVAAMSGTAEDLNRNNYQSVNQNLARLVKTRNPVRFAYILGEREGKMIFLVDSEPPDSPDYSPPGQIYEEATEADWIPFREGRAILTEPATDRWGTWISALVPIKDPLTDKVIAVFGVDYAASDWNLRLWRHMLPDILVVLSVLTLFAAFLKARSQNFALETLGERLAQSENLYRSVFHQAPIGVALMQGTNFEYESESENLNINPMFEKIMGRTKEELKTLQWTDLTYHEDLKTDLARFTAFIKGEIDGYSLEKRFLRPDGEIIWTNIKISRLVDSQSNKKLHLFLLEDISQQKETERGLEESERSKSVLLANLPGMAYRCSYDREWTMQFVSAGCRMLTGYPAESLINNRELSYNDLIAPEYRDRLWQEWAEVVAEKTQFRYEYEIFTADGGRKWVLELGEGVFENNQVTALEGIVIDISEQKKYEEILEYNNLHDRGTGLYNRLHLETLLARDAKRQTEEGRALIAVNLTATQTLTKVFGFHYTQDLLKRLAGELAGLATGETQLFNTFHDRFVFYLRGCNKQEIIEFCRSIEEAITPILKPERVAASLGAIELNRENDSNADLILKKLLIASEKAPDAPSRSEGVSFYDEELEVQIVREEELKRELARITDDDGGGGLFLLYQPILDLKSDKICGFEALARLNSEKFGLVPPLEFIPIAEKTKLIVPIGWKIIDRALKFLRRLQTCGGESVTVSINVSVIQLLQEDFTDKLFEKVTDAQVSPDNVGIELTESIFSLNLEEINSIIKRLRMFGLQVAIDDFGTGYSSFARQRELNVSCLKIDKYFIDKLLDLDLEKALTGDIISMAHKMGHCAIAEGIEYETQKQYLREHGCDKIQGYLVSRPLSEEDALELLRKDNV